MKIRQCDNECGNGFCCNYNIIFGNIDLVKKNRQELADSLFTWELRKAQSYIAWGEDITRIMTVVPCSCTHASVEGCQHPDKPERCITFPLDSKDFCYCVADGCKYAYMDNVYEMGQFEKISLNNLDVMIEKEANRRLDVNISVSTKTRM